MCYFFKILQKSLKKLRGKKSNKKGTEFEFLGLTEFNFENESELQKYTVLYNNLELGKKFINYRDSILKELLRILVKKGRVDVIEGLWRIDTPLLEILLDSLLELENLRIFYTKDDL